MRVECSCGKTIKVPDHLAGKKFRCPACAKVLLARVEEEAAEPATELPSAPNAGKRPRPELEEHNEEPQRPNRMKKGKRKGKSQASFAGRYGTLLGVSGGAAVVGAVVLIILLSRGNSADPNHSPEGPGAGGHPHAGGPPPATRPQAPTLTAEAAKQKVDELVGWANDVTLKPNEFRRKAMPLINELTDAKQGELAADELIGVLKSDHVPSRIKAARSLFLIGPQAQKFIPEIIEALQDPEYDVKRRLIQALGRICAGESGQQPADTPKVVRALIPILEAPLPPDFKMQQRLFGRSPIQSYALQALGSIGATAAEAVPRIIPLLESDSIYVRSNAAVTLGKIGGPSAAKAIPILQRLATSDPSEGVRMNANYALGKLQSM